MKAKKRRGVEAPAKVRAVIDLITGVPLEEIEVPLQGFSWDFERGDFYQWVDLFNHFDTFYETFVQPRKDLRLEGFPCDEVLPLPKGALIEILRVSKKILEHCGNKHLFLSCEHVGVLLACSETEIVHAALQLLASYVRKPFLTKHGKWHGDSAVVSRLFALAQGWGGKEEGLGLLACALEDGLDAASLKVATTLHFEFYGDRKEEASLAGGKSGLCGIHIHDVDKVAGDDLTVLQAIVAEHNVPIDVRFSLLTRLRYSRGFGSLGERRKLLEIRLLALVVFLQSNSDLEAISALYNNESEMVNELIMLLGAEDAVSEEIRTVAVMALTTQAQDRQRQASVLSVIGGGGHRGLLPNLLQKCITAACAGRGDAESGGGKGRGGSGSRRFLAALLTLVTALVNFSAGCTALREAGVIAILLPMLKNRAPGHRRLVNHAVILLETFLDFSNTAAAMFRDAGGLGDTIARLKYEVGVAEEMVMTKAGGTGDEVATLGGSSGVVLEMIEYYQRLLIKALLRLVNLGSYAHGTVARQRVGDETALPLALGAIFKHAKVFGAGVFTLASTLMSDLINHNPTSYVSLEALGLPGQYIDCLERGVLPVTDCILGIPSALIALCLHSKGLQTVKDRKALNCFITIFTSRVYQKALASSETTGLLGAGLDELMRHVPSLRKDAIEMAMAILKRVVVMGGLDASTEVGEGSGEGGGGSHEGDIQGAAGEDEVTLSTAAPMAADVPPPVQPRATGEEMAIAESGGGTGVSAEENQEEAGGGERGDVAVPMDTDSQEREVAAGAVEGAKAWKELPLEDIAEGEVEACVSDCVSNTTRLLEGMLSNSESSRMFIEMSGIEALLSFYRLPNLSLAFGGSQAAHGMTLTLRSFTSQHGAILSRSVLKELRKTLAKAAGLTGGVLVGTLLDEVKGEERCALVESLAVADRYLALTAVLVRSSVALMTELGGDGGKLMADLAVVYKEVQWQLAADVDLKATAEKESGEAGEGGAAAVPATDGFDGGELLAAEAEMSQYADDWPLPGTGHGAAVFVPPFPGLGEGDRGPMLRQQGGRHRNGAGGVRDLHAGGRNVTRASRQADEAAAEVAPGGETIVPEVKNVKPALILEHEMLARLGHSARSFFIALGKVMVVPSRRREDVVSLTLPAKMVAGELAHLINSSLKEDGAAVGKEGGSWAGHDEDQRMRLRMVYRGKVVKDVYEMLVDQRRGTVNTALLNSMYGRGTVKEVLEAFKETYSLAFHLMSQVEAGSSLEGRSGEGSKDGMGAETVVSAGKQQIGGGDNSLGRPWVMNTLTVFGELLQQITSAPLLSLPAASAQLLVQPVAKSVVPVPSDPEVFVRTLQAEVLESLLPLWKNPLLVNLPLPVLTSISETLVHILAGGYDAAARINQVAAQISAAALLRERAARPIVPPLDENVVGMIVEMGFPRPRAEAALRHVGTNSVEAAMEWLLTNPLLEEPPVADDDELAMALAMSMGPVAGSGGGEDKGMEKAGEEEEVEGRARGVDFRAPSVDEILETSLTLVRNSKHKPLMFQVADLLLTLSWRQEGRDRKRVVTYLVDHLRQCSTRDTASLYMLSHVLVVMCVEDTEFKKAAAGVGLAGVALDLLESLVAGLQGGVLKDEDADVNEGLAALLLMLENLTDSKLKVRSSRGAVLDPRARGAQAGGTAGEGAGTSSRMGTATLVEGSEEASEKEGGASGVAGAEGLDPYESTLDKLKGYLSESETERALSVCLCLLRRGGEKGWKGVLQQAVLQLTARATKEHGAASMFIAEGGLQALLALPNVVEDSETESLVSVIIKHLIEGPQTLQAAMESQIKQTLVYLQGRQPNRQVTPASFLAAVAPLIARDPEVFLASVKAVTELDKVGEGKAFLVLKKDKDKGQGSGDEVRSGGKVEQGGLSSAMALDGGGQALAGETSRKGACSRSGSTAKQKVPETFAEIVYILLEEVMRYQPADQGAGKGGEEEAVTPMEVDEGSAGERRDLDVEGRKAIEPKRDSGTALMRFILCLLSEILLTYVSASTVVIRRDTESSSHSKGEGAQGVPSHGGLLHHVLHRLMPMSGDWGEKPRTLEDKVSPRREVGDWAASFLVAVCMRSSEGRKRVVAKLAKGLLELAGGEGPCRGMEKLGAVPLLVRPDGKLRGWVELAYELLCHPSPTPGGTGATMGVSNEVYKLMLDAGMVEALTQILETLDLDHPQSTKVANAVLKVLEGLSRLTSAGDGRSGAHHARKSGGGDDRGGGGESSTGGGGDSTGRAPEQQEVQDGGAGRGGPAAGGVSAGDEIMRESPTAAEAADAGEGGEGGVGVRSNPGEAEDDADGSPGGDEGMEHDHREEGPAYEDGVGGEQRHQGEHMEAFELYEEALRNGPYGQELREAVEDEMEYIARLRNQGLDDMADEEEMMLERSHAEMMEGDDGGDGHGDDDDEDDDDLDEDDEDHEHDMHDMHGRDGMGSPPDTDVEEGEEDGEDVGDDGDEEEEEGEDDGEDEDGEEGEEEGDEVYEEEVQDDEEEEEEEEDGEWADDGRMVEVRWRDGQTGLAQHAQIHGTNLGALFGGARAPGAPPIVFRGPPEMAYMNLEDLFGNLRGRQVAVRRMGGFRGGVPASPGRAGAPRPLHPLLARPGQGGAWASGGGTGGAARLVAQTEPTLGQEVIAHIGQGRGGMPIELAMADHRHIVDHFAGAGAPNAERLASIQRSRVVGATFRGAADGREEFMQAPYGAGRTDHRIPSWHSDSLPRDGAVLAAIATEIESCFVEHLDVVTHPEPQTPAPAAPPEGAAAEGLPSEAPEQGADVLRDGEGLPRPVGEQDMVVEEPRAVGEGEAMGSAGGDAVEVEGAREDGEVRRIFESLFQSGGRNAGNSASGADVPMAAPDGDGDEQMAEPAGGVVPRGEGAETDLSGRQPPDPAADAVEGEGVASEEVGGGDGAAGGSSAGGIGDRGEATIDPAFLEALPEDLRAEVLASRQAQTTRAANPPPGGQEDLGVIDPEFMAALPPEIQLEVMAQQRAQRIMAAHQAEEGQPVDMDSASIIATFPRELREEVLLTSNETVLAALPPALLAEANMLRDRAMGQFVGGYGGQRRRWSNPSNAALPPGLRRAAVVTRDVGGELMAYVIGRGIGGGSRNTHGSAKVVDSEGKALLDVNALRALLRLLRLAQPTSKGLLQRLLMNLCTHPGTRATIVQLVLDMLQPEVVGQLAADGAPRNRLYGCQSSVVYARPQEEDGLESRVSPGSPPLLSKRLLELLIYLAKHSEAVAQNLIQMKRPKDVDPSPWLESKVDRKGKGKMREEGEGKEEVALVLLFRLLNYPLYSRSSRHLEQLLGLVDLILKHSSSNVRALRQRTDALAAARESVAAVEVAAANAAAAASAAVEARGRQRRGEAAPPVEAEQAPEPVVGGAGEAAPEGSREQSAARTDGDMAMPAADGAGGSSEGGARQSKEAMAEEAALKKLSERAEQSLEVLLHLPAHDLKLTATFLAKDGLSEAAYALVSGVLKVLADVVPAHRQLFVAELAAAARGLSGPALEELLAVSDGNGSSMAGGATLRVLQTLSALIDGLSEKESGMAIAAELNVALEPLWQGLSTAASAFEAIMVNMPAAGATAEQVAAGGATGLVPPPPMPPGTQRLLPFVEAFFVLWERLRAGQAEEVGGEEERWHGTRLTKFADKHRKLLNAFVRQNSQMLQGSLALLLKTPRLLDFDNKRTYFRHHMKHVSEQAQYGSLRINVRRAYVLEDSYNQLRMRTPAELKGRLTVQFQGEEGVDAGGLTREWYQLLSRVVFDKGALLFTTMGSDATFQPNPNSDIQTEHLSYFRFVGRVVAKALHDAQLLDVHFTRSFYKHILGMKVVYQDIEAIDPEYAQGLHWILNNDITHVIDQVFVVEADEEKVILYGKGAVKDHELVPGGRDQRVTEENKAEYVDLTIRHKLTESIRPQINAFLQGFNELIPREVVEIFNDKELELLISGLPEIDVEDLRCNTEYSGYTATHPVIHSFWEVVEDLSKEDMARLLQFITGTSRVPLEGFQALQGISGPQRFQIHKAYGDGGGDRLPSAHTCFNQLDLPEYSSKEVLRERLLMAIHEANEGFGFA